MSGRGAWWGRNLRSAGVCALLVAVLGLPSGPSPASGDGTEANARRDQGSAVPVGASGTSGADESLPPGQRWTVTLLTGEVVEVRTDTDGRATAQVVEHRGPYRTLREADGSLHVIPLAVTPLVGEVLDVDLFDVTGMIRQGYDDESRDSIGLIVEREPGADVNVPAVFDSPEEQPLPSIGATAVDVPKQSTDDLGADLRAESQDLPSDAELFDGVTRVWLDSRVTAAGLAPTAERERVGPVPAAASPAPSSTSEGAGLDGNLTQIGADVAWRAGFTGEGATVAVLDTGIDVGHPDLAGKVVAEENFTGEPSTDDWSGHGTHVAATAAGSGAGAVGVRSGVAPDAAIVNGKVLDGGGSGWESDVIAGMEWAAPRADVVNMSIGALPLGADDPMTAAVDRLTEQHGALFVVAAGNSGPLSATVDSPGAAERALTVGAVDGEDQLADFSGRGPTVETYFLKPEVVAPGVDIVAARAANGYIGSPVDEHYTRLSGTSMATPHAAGAAAVLAQQHPDWDADRLKSALVGSGDPIEADGWDMGGGRLDVGEAVGAQVRAEPAVVDALLPEPRTEPHRESVTWTNDGDEPLTVDFEASLQDRHGQPVEAVSVTPAEVVVDPGATATASLEIDAPGLGTGLYSGLVTAHPEPQPGQSGSDDADDAEVRLPLGIYAAPPFVNLTIEATGPGRVPGERPPVAFFAVVNLDDAGQAHHFGYLNRFGGFDGDSVTFWVPAGRYSVTGDVSTGDETTAVVAQVGDPDVSVTEDTTVAFDGQAAQPFVPTVEGVETAPPLYSGSELIVQPDVGSDGFGLFTSAVYASYPMPPVHLIPMEAAPGTFAQRQIFRLQAPHLRAEASQGPIEITGVPGPPRDRGPGRHTLAAVDAGDGSDFTGAGGKLAVVRLPAEMWQTQEITERAAQAEVALLAFVDESRSHLTFQPWHTVFWAELPVVAAADAGASQLIEAATRGEEVTVEVAASPYVYDLVRTSEDRVEPNPVIDQAEQAQLAGIDERFHRDSGGPDPTGDGRYDVASLFRLESEGPLPEARTAHVSPDVDWLSAVFGLLETEFGRSVVLFSGDAGQRYARGEQHRLDWLRRPQWPAAMGGDDSPSGCQPTPVERSADRLDVWLIPLQDGRNRYTCADPLTATMTLARDGEVIGTVDRHWESFPVPAEPGTYRLSYEQEVQAPYAHRSQTAWTFRSAAPTGESPAAEAVPLLVAEYELPLDTQNRLTGDRATFRIRHVTGSGPPVLPPTVRTSTDGGDTWQRARVRPTRAGRFEVRLPEVDPGTSVSLQVDARDVRHNRIEQTLYDAYVG